MPGKEYQVKNKGKTFEQMYDGDDIPLYRLLYLRCCDCGLVHDIQHRKNKNSTSPFKVTVSIFRDKRRTAASRRSARYKGLKLPLRLRKGHIDAKAKN